MSEETRSRPVHENLNSSFVNLSALLHHLRQDNFTGRVHVTMSRYEAIVYLNGRELPRVHETDHVTGQMSDDPDGLQRLMMRASVPGAVINVFEDGEARASQGPAVSAAPLFEAAAGPAERPVRRARARAERAEPEKAPVVVSPEQVPAPAPVVVAEPDTAEEGSAAAATLVQEEAGPVAIADQPEERPMEAAFAGPVPVAAPEAQPSIAEDAVPAFADVRTPAEAPREPGMTPVEAEWARFVQTSSSVFAAVERAALGLGVDFGSLLTGVRQQLADDFPFLDPSADQFDYDSGSVRLASRPGASTYLAGVVECMRRVVERMTQAGRARTVRERVALELAVLARKQKEQLTHFRFISELDRIAGTRVL